MSEREQEYTYYSPRLDKRVPFQAIKICDRRRSGLYGITEFHNKMKKHGFTSGQADTVYAEFVTDTLLIEIKLEAPYIRCEITKYFTVIVQNRDKTPPIRFEVRGEFTVPAKYAEPNPDESEADWKNRFGDYLEEKIEPIMDDVLEKWGNQERIVTTLDGRTERWQNVLDLDNFTKSLSITGVEKFEGTGSFKTNIDFDIVKIDRRSGRIKLQQTYSSTVSENELA